MAEPSFYLDFLRPLCQSNLNFFVTGSIASIMYGEPRMTYDIDLVLELHINEIDSFVTLFPPTEFYCPPKDVVMNEVARDYRGHFNIINFKSGFKADIYPFGIDELHIWAMTNRRMMTIDGLEIPIAPPEYVIIRKLQYYKEGKSIKHLRDIKKMLDISSSMIDQNFLQKMVVKYGLKTEFKEAKNISEGA